MSTSARREARRKARRKWNTSAGGRAYMRLYRQLHPETIATARRRFRKSPKGKASEMTYRAGAMGKAARRRAQHLRRARKRGCAVTLRPQEWQAVLDEHGNSCAYCGISGVPLEQDHVVPLRRGGGHTMSNIVPACRTCNNRKNASLGWIPQHHTANDRLRAAEKGLSLRDHLEGQGTLFTLPAPSTRSPCRRAP